MLGFRGLLLSTQLQKYDYTSLLILLLILILIDVLSARPEAPQTV